MTAVTHPSKVNFYPLRDLNGIDDERCICLNELKNGKSSILSNMWNNKEVLVHKNENATKGYSCFIHRDCLKDWLPHNAICPNCKSPADPDSVYTWKDKAGTIILDGIEGGWNMCVGSFSTVGLVILGLAMKESNPLKSFSTTMQQLAISKEVHQTALLIFTCGAVALSGARYVKRKGWFFKGIPLR